MSSPLQSLLRQTRPLAGWMALSALLGVLTVGSGIGLMTLSAYLISEAALHPSYAALLFAILGVRFFGIVRGVWRYGERVVSHEVSFRLLARLRVWFYQALEPLAPARLLARTHTRSREYTSGDLLSRLVSDIETLQDFYVRSLAPTLVAAAIGIIMWFVLGAYNLTFAIVLLAFYLLAGVGVPLVMYLSGYKLEERIIIVRSDLKMALIDSIQGMADLLAYGREREQAERVLALNRQLVRLQAARARVRGLREAAGSVLMNLCVWTMLFVAIPLVREGRLNGVYLAFLTLAAVSSFEAVLPLSAAAQGLRGSLEAGRRLFGVIDAPPVIRDPATPSPVPSSFDLEVRHLSFRYAEDAPYALRDICFALPQGHCLALVGPSGAGKSTLANVLQRFWEYEEGSSRLGGHELRAYHQEDLHRLVSVVEQRPHLFNATIRENLLLAQPDASQDEVEEAARQAWLHDFIQSLPQGYETLIGEQGLKLSGGERQRLAIARALLKNAPILLLDEVTANLDPLTEREVLRTVRTLLPGRTTIVITHRLVGLEMADEILVLHAGAIKERGTHADLLQAEGLYWHLWLLQSQVLATS
ncbi:MAG: thiol reductant ABC exporter subunit CydC [Ktedonobacteraceae bacterium]